MDKRAEVFGTVTKVVARMLKDEGISQEVKYGGFRFFLPTFFFFGLPVPCDFASVIFPLGFPDLQSRQCKSWLPCDGVMQGPAEVVSGPGGPLRGQNTRARNRQVGDG